ncbi:MAG: hypothetical protein C4562_02915 [Actinobacteria bacterium]|nr:MAG: hypothetical protein C4562_02915 [Actinomycetota bacterium]
MYKTKCPGCGYTHCIVGDLGINWILYVFKCDHCGSQVAIRRVSTKDDEVKKFKDKLRSIKTVDDFLDL